MNTLKGASSFIVFITELFEGANIQKNFSVTLQVQGFSKSL